MAGVQAVEGRIAEIPARAVKGKSVVDHARYEPRPRLPGGLAAHQRAIKDALAAIGIAHPLVEDQDGAEVVEVHHLAISAPRAKNRTPPCGWGRRGSASRNANPVPPGCASEPNEKLTSGFAARNLSVTWINAVCGAAIFRKSRNVAQRASFTNTRQCCGLLRNFTTYQLRVVGFQQMGLGASSHLAHVPDSGERHWKRML